MFGRRELDAEGTAGDLRGGELPEEEALECASGSGPRPGGALGRPGEEWPFSFPSGGRLACEAARCLSLPWFRLGE